MVSYRRCICVELGSSLVLHSGEAQGFGEGGSLPEAIYRRRGIAGLALDLPESEQDVRRPDCVAQLAYDLQRPQ